MAGDKLKTAACIAILLAVNGYIAWELFSIEYTWHIGSIAGPYIALARYITENWRDLAWWPFWYAGIPYQNTYPPLLHFIVAGVAVLARITPALSYHAVVAAFYCLGPVTLFLMAHRLSGLRLYSFAAALLYSVFSPSIVLVPAIRNDIGSVFHPRRLQALVHYGEGPHVASMTLLPVAIVLLHLAFEKRRRIYWFLTALAMAAVVLTNWIGGFALAGAVVAYLLSRSQPLSAGNWMAALAAGFYAYIIASPWIPPSTLKAIRTNAQHIGGDYAISLQHLKYAGLLLIAVVLIDLWFERRKPAAHLRFALYFSLFMGAVALGAEYWNAVLVPQPQRYHLEMEMAFILALIFPSKLLLDRLSMPRRTLILLGFALFCACQVRAYRGFAKWMNRPIDPSSTVEYKTARWLKENMNGRRVLVPGATGFWMHVWTGVPLLNGGFDQGIPNWHVTAALHQIYSGENAGPREGEIAVMWMKAYGVHAVAVVREFYQSFANPRKFEGLLKPLMREGENVIYEIPQRSPSLAHVIRPQDVVDPEPVDALDVEPLKPFLAALDNPELPPAGFQWESHRRAVIRANLRKEHLLSVQITYHPGWRARVNGQPCRVRRDKLGMILLEPACEGPCTVDLVYDGGVEMHIARALSWSGLLAGLLWIAAGWKKRSSKRSGNEQPVRGDGSSGPQPGPA